MSEKLSFSLRLKRRNAYKVAIVGGPEPKTIYQ
jgi:hypothetical protein